MVEDALGNCKYSGGRSRLTNFGRHPSMQHTMKGLILSLGWFAVAVLATMVISHITRPRNYSRVLLPTLLAGAPLYLATFFLTPPDLGFLGPAWLAHPAWLDASYGAVVYLLNAHSYYDFFWAFNGGFSMSLMLEILRHGPAGARTPDLVGRYVRPDGVDKIYGWRLPRLAESGMIEIDEAAGQCRLTKRGDQVARFTRFWKRFLNLGEGG